MQLQREVAVPSTSGRSHGSHPGCSLAGRSNRLIRQRYTGLNSSRVQAQQEGRSRSYLLRSSTAGLLVQLLIGSDDPTTIVNSVLSAYGLPTLKAAAGFKLYDDFDAGYAFEYPKSWVIRPNSLRQGLYISDFQTADKVTLEVFSLPPDRDLAGAAVAAAVVPGAGAGQQDSRLELPPAESIQQQEAELEGLPYTYLAFPSETITRSGYQVRRRNYVAAALRDGTAYVLAASARSDQCGPDKVELLRHVVESFRVRG